jgi:hypothetical protein
VALGGCEPLLPANKLYEGQREVRLEKSRRAILHWRAFAPIIPHRAWQVSHEEIRGSIVYGWRGPQVTETTLVTQSQNCGDTDYDRRHTPPFFSRTAWAAPSNNPNLLQPQQAIPNRSRSGLPPREAARIAYTETRENTFSELSEQLDPRLNTSCALYVTIFQSWPSLRPALTIDANEYVLPHVEQANEFRLLPDGESIRAQR